MLKTILNFALITLACFLVITVFDNGWFNSSRNYSDTPKITEDGKYEYKLQLRKAFQRNSSVRLYIEDIQTQDKIYVPLDIYTRDLGGFSMGQENHWGILTYN